MFIDRIEVHNESAVIFCELVKRFVFCSSFPVEKRLTHGLYVYSELLGNFQNSLFCQVVTYFLQNSFETVIVVGYGDFPSLGSLLCGPVQVTFVFTEVSVVSAS